MAPVMKIGRHFDPRTVVVGKSACRRSNNKANIEMKSQSTYIVLKRYVMVSSNLRTKTKYFEEGSGTLLSVDQWNRDIRGTNTPSNNKADRDRPPICDMHARCKF